MSQPIKVSDFVNRKFTGISTHSGESKMSIVDESTEEMEALESIYATNIRDTLCENKTNLKNSKFYFAIF